jgi:hypothetical protein
VDWTHVVLIGALAGSLLFGLRHRRHRTIRIIVELERDDTDTTRKGTDDEPAS